MDAAIRKAKDSLGQIFDKNLHDLVRGIRNHKENEAKYISECIDEIKQELKQDNMAVKANAINKLCYLEMLGYDISWAAFNVIEVMSSTKFTYKRIGYLAAAQSFHEGTDVLMLTTNMIRKDLGSQNMYESGIALSGLACFITPDLARDLANEIMTLMTNNKPYIRKKAVLIMYKIFLKYPDALRPSFPRLKEKLDDPEPSVQAAAVNVICELARKNPKNYLSLAPIFFKLMTVSTNNWVLIKIIKLFGALTPLEPRLGKKLIEPLTNLINSTSAMSLLYECINTVLAVLVSISSGQPNHNSAIQICLQKLRILIEDSDQNLKYLGLLAMSKILQTNPLSVQAHKDLIMQCLDDKDESIRLRSLDLLYGMVTKKNLMEIIKKLMVHMNKAEGTHYRDELLAKIVDICSQNNYQYVTNFDWYVSVLVELTRMEGTRHGKLLSSQMLDVAIRVESIRPFIVMQMSILIDNMHVFTTSSIVNQSSNKNNTSDICEVLYAATWICGEFPEHLSEPMKTMESMLKSKVTNLPGHIQSSFIQNVFKLYSHIISRIYANSNDGNDDDFVLSSDGIEECKQMTKYVSDRILQFEQSADIEVQERACTMLQILKYVQKMLDKQQQDEDESVKSVRVDLELASLFEGELNPVAPKAQRKVPIPEGLDLDEWINDPPSDDESEEASSSENQMFMKQSESMYNNINNNNRKPESFTSLSSAANYGGHGDTFTNQSISGNLGAKKLVPELSEEDLAKYRESRKMQIESNPFYIKSSSNNVKKSESNSLLSNGISNSINPNDIRSQSIDLKVPIIIPGVTSSDSYYRMTQIDLENKKLKKKMKNKLADKKKKKGKNAQVEEMEEDEDEEIPVVKVLTNEMPEGAIEDSDEDERSKRNPNDPHRALDINLDEPLKDEEKLPIPSHRITSNKKTTSNKSNLDQDSLKQMDNDEKKTKKSKNVNKEKSPKSDETKKEKKKVKEKEKKSSKKSSSSNKDINVDLLISTDLQTNRNENDYNELISPDQESQNTLDGNSNSYEREQVKTSVEEKTQPIVKSQSDDLDFWLSGTTQQSTTTPIENENNEEEKSSKKKSSKSKKAKDSVETEETTKSKKKSKKSKDADTEEGEKKSSKKSKELVEKNETINTEIQKEKQNGSTTKSLYKNLTSNKNLKLAYFIRPNPMNLNQIIINLKISSSKSTQNISSIELNILDASSIKFIRDSGGDGDPIKLGFKLNQKQKENSTELYFNATECTFSQKLKGTLTYILKNEDDDDSAHEKIDFKLNVSCSSYLIKTECDSDEFSNYLTGGQLNSKYSIKFETTNYDSIEAFVESLQSQFNFNVVEIVDNNASLFSSTIQNHPVCILAKLLNDNKTITIDGKSTNSSLIQDILEDIKTNFTS